MSVTLVTCYYKLVKSKHSLQDYDCWIKNFLLNINNTNIIIFHGKNDKEYIQTIIDKNKKTINYLLIEKEIDDFELVKKYDRHFWNRQESIDPNKYCGRGQDCYKLWNSKFNLLKEAIEKNPFNSDKFIWNDIGNVRDLNIVTSCLNNYPKYNSISNNKLDIVLLNRFNNPYQRLFQNEIHFSGSMFGGGKELILELCKLFYIFFDIYVHENLFIGCDQQIIASLFIKYSDKFNLIIPKNNFIDKWFYLYSHYCVD
jgi:hypothetical protein